MKKLWQLLVRHLRIGCSRNLLAGEAALLAIIAIDYCRFGVTGLCLTAPLRFAPAGRAYYWTGAGLFLVVLVLAPIANAFARILFSLPMKSAVNDGRFMVVHVALSVLLGLGAMVAANLRTLAGVQLGAAGAVSAEYAFQPFFMFIVGLSHLGLKVVWKNGLVFSAIGALSLAVFKKYVLPNEPSPAVRHYLDACRLADLNPSYVPTEGSARLNFSEPAVAAEAPFVKSCKDALIRDYVKMMPGSQAANREIDRLRKYGSQLMREVLGVPASVDETAVELYASVGRAMEVALDRSGPSPDIFISPFEHRNTRATVDWFKSLSQVRVFTLDCDKYAGWQLQRSSIFNQIAESADRARPIVLIMSEVNLYTGMIVPIPSLLDDLRGAGYEVRTMIDASHSAGNGGRLRFLEHADWYIFAAHKWLLSPEPCGILINRAPCAARPYDAWSIEKPHVAADIGALAAFIGALELARQEGFPQLWERSRLLQNTFLERMHDRFEVLGEHDPNVERTLISCVKPGAGFRWREGFLTIIDEAELGIYVNDAKNLGAASIRVAFPYFLSIWRLNGLCAVLENSIQRFGIAPAAQIGRD